MKRKGFTLIELMVVIAIIIILAAVAIPNYINMTKRAKRSRVMSDMGTLATGLEAFRTDWGKYPVITTAEDVSAVAGVLRKELGAGEDATATGVAETNIAGKTNSAGEAGGISYIKDETLAAIKNPFYADEGVMYVSEANGVHFAVYALQNETSGAADAYLVRTDKVSAAYDADAAPTSADLAD